MFSFILLVLSSTRFLSLIKEIDTGFRLFLKGTVISTMTITHFLSHYRRPRATKSGGGTNAMKEASRSEL